MNWAPEPQPWLLWSITLRYRIRRTAVGYAIYDYALGTLVSKHPEKTTALRLRKIKSDLLRQEKQANGIAPDYAKDPMFTAMKREFWQTKKDNRR